MEDACGDESFRDPTFSSIMGKANHRPLKDSLLSFV